MIFNEQTDALLQGLNQAQRDAVLYTEGPSLVIAGAGSGKTRMLTHKIAYLLLQGLSPYHILALTFTNKAAREMKQRIATIVGEQTANRLWMGTFHSIFARILRSNAELLGFPSAFTIYDTTDSRSLLKSILKERGLDDKIYKVTTVHGIISSAKNALITPEAYTTNKEIIQNDIRAKRPELGLIYTLYRNRCKQAGAMDFDDLLLYTNVLFRDFPEVVARYRELFEYILVDEYQDTNLAQHLIVRQLVKGHERLCVVGDDAQSIYSFRGAQIDHILNMRQEYPNCRIFKLERNYRSTQSIVEAANSLIRKNKGQIAKNSYSKNEVGKPLQVISTDTDYVEAEVIAKRIKELYLRDHVNYEEVAILYRTNAQSRVFEEKLRMLNIPYRIYGGLSFYQRKEIKDVIAYFRMIINPHDEEALKRIINYPTRGIGDTTVTKIALCAANAHCSMWEVISDPVAVNLPINSGTATKLANFKRLIESLHAKNEELNIFDFTNLLLVETGIRGDLNSDQSVETMSKRENIEELLNGIRDFYQTRLEEDSNPATLVDFLSEVSLATDQDKKEEEENTEKITLMTVHASKGLEFDFVFVVGLEEDLFPSAMCKLSSADLEEERRLLYVAITRARKECTLSYAGSRFRNGQSTASPPSRFIKEMDERYLSLPSGGGFLNRRVQERAADFAARNPLTAYSRSTSHATEPAHSTASRLQRLKPIEKATLSPSSTHSTENETIQVGDFIQHERFGKGHVTAITGNDESRKISVCFQQVGEKQLLLRFARFTIIK